MKRWTAALVVAAGFLGAGAAEAQEGWAVRVTPRAGVLTPAGWFYYEYSHFGLDPVEWTEAAILRAPVAGLAAELEIPGTAVWIRGEVLRTFDAITSMTHAVLWETSGFEPPRVERTPYRVDTAILMGSLDLAFPTRFRVGPVQPYVTAGVGGKRYAFDTDPFTDVRGEVVLPQPGTVAMANIGAGTTVRVLGVTFDLQVRDALSHYWGRLQNDVMVFGGISWEVF